MDDGLGVVGRPHSCIALVGLPANWKLMPAEVGGADEGTAGRGNAVTGELRWKLGLRMWGGHTLGTRGLV